MIAKRPTGHLAASAVAAFAAVFMTVGAASAATVPPGRMAATHSAMTAPPGGALQAGASIRVTTRQATQVQISASTYCNTAYKAWNGYEYGVLQWTLSMKTVFCYDFNTVVSHRTTVSETHRYNWGYYQHSYTSVCLSGCRENQQTVFSTFYWSAVYLAVDIHLQLTENQNGGWSWKVWTTTY
jgi:hypothetical protein